LEVAAIIGRSRYTDGVARKPIDHARECDERLTQAFALLGKRWSGVILGVLLQAPAHFAVLARTIPGISERMLSDRLNELAEAGLIDRTVLDGPPLGVVYKLTESGRAMGPGLLKLGEWAERYMAPAARTRGRLASRHRLQARAKETLRSR
jgi:DNA-binding HxlR family transcriptional regulator